MATAYDRGASVQVETPGPRDVRGDEEQIRAPVDEPVRRDSARALIAWTIGMVALAVVLLWTLYLSRHVMLLVYVSILLAAGFSPLVRGLERQRFLPVGRGGVPHWLAILIGYGGIVAVLLGLAAAVMPAIVSQARQLAASLPGMLERFDSYLAGRGISVEIPSSMSELMQQADLDGAALGTMMATMEGVIGGVFGVVTILILTFYLLVESHSLLRGFLGFLPETRRQQAELVTQQVVYRASAWLNGQLMLAALIGGLTALVLGVLGVPYFYVVALVAGLGEFLPYIGPLLAAAIGVGVALGSSTQLAIGVAIFFFVQQQLENHILVPKLMAHQVGVSPAIVIIALLIGGALLGITGMILAVPTAAIIQVIAEEMRHDGPLVRPESS